MVKYYTKSTITSVISVVPSKEIKLQNVCEDYGWTDKQAKKIKSQIGIDAKRICNENETSLYLMRKAIDETIERNKLNVDEIDALIVINQTPDFIQPGNSKLLQSLCHLKKETFCLDINSGCSGYTDGLILSQSLIDKMNLKKLLLVTGDCISKIVDPKDRATAPLFGDAASCTVLCSSEDHSEAYISYGSDGKGYDSLFVEKGGARNPSTNDESKLYMNGNDIMVFSITTEPKSINELMSFSGLQRDLIDYVVLHQANKYIIENIRKRINFPEAKVLRESFSNFGNTSSSSIPLSISFELNEKIVGEKTKFLLSGFGVGLTWSSIIVDFDLKTCPKVIEA